ncbi:MAG: glycosyltransferase, partial [bacterium]|nr:glycosyltransferase [bacterium]
TARRVEKFYRRESSVIYPPVEAKALSVKRKVEISPYFLSVGRLTYAKRVDLAIRVCNALNVPLKIVGVGKEERYLRGLASQGEALRSRNIEFLGSVSDEELSELYAGARALIFCALDEDFGIVPVEAMAHGVPVIALGQGGVLETVIDGKTGVLFSEPTVESLTAGLSRFISIRRDWSVGCRRKAKKFDTTRFKAEIKEFVKKSTKKVAMRF